METIFNSLFKNKKLILNTSKLLLLLFILTVFVISCGPKLQLIPLEPAPEPVTGFNGMVVAAHPLAAEAGLKILKEGGNAVDAALATLFMLNVVEPHASGLGGGGFGLIRMAEGEAKVVLYRENTSVNIDLDFYYDPADTNHSRMKHGGSAACVPGSAAGWAEMYDNWASLPLEQLMSQAIDKAENGFVVDRTLAVQIANNMEGILADSAMSNTFLNYGLPYEMGDTLYQPTLAKTLKFLSSNGLMSFYKGWIAEGVMSASQAGGGFIDLNDLENYKTEIVDPVTVDLSGELKGYTALAVPPPSRGGTGLIEALHLFELTKVFNEKAHSASAIHLMSQSLQQAYADARRLIGDPKFSDNDWEMMIDKDFARHASEGISLEAEPGPRKTAVPDTSEHGNTTHLSVLDKWGNAVSLTQTINHFFGAGVMASGAGFILNNQMDDFNLLQPDSLNLPPNPNLIEPGKRPRSNMAPLIVLKKQKPVLIVGTPGGGRIIAAMAQIVVNALVLEENISQAIDYPRFFPVENNLVFENRYPRNTLKEIKEKGYVLHFAGPYHVYFGGAHGITFNLDTGEISGAADPRRGGAAKGY